MHARRFAERTKPHGAWPILGRKAHGLDGAAALDSSAAGLAPPDDQEAALLPTLAAGSFTAIVRGANGETGLALAEAYRLP